MIKNVRAEQKNMKFLNAPTFAAAEKVGTKRPKITDIEWDITKQYMQRFLVGKSGARSATHYTELDKKDLIEIYRDKYANIIRECNAEGLEVKYEPRSYHVMYRILKELHVVKVKQAKHCHYCQDAATIDHDIKLLKMEMADCDDEEESTYLEEELAHLQKKKAKIIHHLEKLEVQKSTILNIRKGLRQREAFLTLDFLSWYRKDSSKTNDCSFTLETNPTGLDGGRECKFIDVPCHDKDTMKHNHFFVANAVHEVLFKSGLFIDEKTKQRKFDKLFVTSDNALVNRWTTLTWNIVQRLTGIQVVYIPGCENHGECLVDAHGGTLKPKMKRADLKNQYPSSEEAMQAFIEKIPNTICIPLKRIDYDWVKKEWYGPYVSNWEDVKPIQGINSTGHIEFPVSAESPDSVVGCVLTRKLYGKPVLWPHDQSKRARNNKPVPPGHQFLGWQFHSTIPTATNTGQVCTTRV